MRLFLSLFPLFSSSNYPSRTKPKRGQHAKREKEKKQKEKEKEMGTTLLLWLSDFSLSPSLSFFLSNIQELVKGLKGEGRKEGIEEERWDEREERRRKDKQSLLVYLSLLEDLVEVFFFSYFFCLFCLFVCLL